MLYPHLTVRDNFRFALPSQPWWRFSRIHSGGQCIQTLAATLGLSDLLDRLPDVSVPDDRPALGTLRGKPRRESYGVLEPIAPWTPPGERGAD